jgi:hypothetical protein
MRGFDLFERERTAARVLKNGLRVYAKSFDAEKGVWIDAMIFMPKGKNPAWRVYSCPDTTFKSAVIRYYRGLDSHNDRKAQERVARVTGDVTKMDPGTILSYGYGYDQTNREFWQVRRRYGLVVYIARIGAERVGEPTSWCSENVAPVKDAFLESCDFKRNGNDRCGLTSMFRLHNDTREADFHPFIAGIDEVRKRFYFSNGEPYLSMHCGIASVVTMLTFENADALPARSYHSSWGH